MTLEQIGDNADDGTGGDTVLSNVTKEHGEEEAKRKADEAVNKLVGFIDQDRYVGDLISMDYNTAEVLIHDRLRQEVGGVPHGCLLLASRIRVEAPEDGARFLSEAQTSLILLRALGASPLPNDIEMKSARLEAGQRAAQTPDNWDEGGKTDQFTLHQMRFAGAHCRILGTFRMKFDLESDDWQLEFGGDIDNFYAGQGMKVYKPAWDALEQIANFTKREWTSSKRVQIGKLRYAASIRNTDTAESVPVYMTAEALLAQRTALFGMTRTGKSNTTKTIANAVFRLRTAENGQKVGQLIFDPNGEYANENPQDQGCLKNIANIREDLNCDVVTYGLHKHPNDLDRRITKFNFFGDSIDSIPSQLGETDKTKLDERLQSLYEGKDIVNGVLREEDAGYIQAFVQADMIAPEDIIGKEGQGQFVRFRRALFVYRAVLARAGFRPPTAGMRTKGLFGSDIRKTMADDPRLAPFVDDLDSDSPMSWSDAGNFCEEFARWSKQGAFQDFNQAYARKKKRNWSDQRLEGLLSIFENSRGLRVLQKALQWHDFGVNTDYAEDIVNHVRAGRLVIFDQALGDPGMNEQAATSIMRRIFAAQQRAFVNPETDNKTKEVKKPPPTIIYVEEAHTLLPRGGETDVTNIWARVAKEGAKFNIGLVYSTQEPSTIQPNILTNTENWFIAHLNNTDETRQLNKYNDFADFTDSIIKVNETGFLRVRTLSSPYTLPVQIDLFKAPVSQELES